MINTIVSDDKLSDRDVRVFIAVLNHINNQKGYAWCGIRYLANYLNKSKNTIQTSINALVKAKWLERKSGSLGKANVYQICNHRVPNSKSSRPKMTSTTSQTVGTYKTEYNSPKGESYIQSNNTSYRGQEAASPVATQPQPTRRLLDD